MFIRALLFPLQQNKAITLQSCVQLLDSTFLLSAPKSQKSIYINTVKLPSGDKANTAVLKCTYSKKLSNFCHQLNLESGRCW